MVNLKKTRELGADLVLASVALVWGVAFTIVKQAVDKVPVFVFLGQRFVLAFLFFIPFVFWQKESQPKRTVIQGLVLGSFLFGAYAFQTVGLKYTTAANAGFITGLNVVLVPVINGFFLRQKIPGKVLWGVALAALGLAGLCLRDGWQVHEGDFIVFFCAFCVAIQIILTGRFVQKSNVYWLAGVQVGVVALLSCIVAVILGQGQELITFEPSILWALVICAPLATTFAFWAQTSMQRFTIPSKTALIFCLEPVFGALYACLFGGEHLGSWALLGGVLIIAGMLLAEWPEK